MTLIFISGSELILVVLLALLFFGADSLPMLARSFGKVMREFKKASNDIQREFEEHTGDVKREIHQISDSVQKTSRKIERDIENGMNDMTSSNKQDKNSK